MSYLETKGKKSSNLANHVSQIIEIDYGLKAIDVSFSILICLYSFGNLLFFRHFNYIYIPQYTTKFNNQSKIIVCYFYIKQ